MNEVMSDINAGLLVDHGDTAGMVFGYSNGCECHECLPLLQPTPDYDDLPIDGVADFWESAS